MSRSFDYAPVIEDAIADMELDFTDSTVVQGVRKMLPMQHNPALVREGLIIDNGGEA